MADYNATTSFLQQQASAALMGANNARMALTSFSGPRHVNAKDVHFDHEVGEFNITKPPLFSDMFSNVDNTDPEILRVNAEMEAYIAKYFPAMSACLKTLPEEWLCNVIGGVKPFGISSTIFDLVWQRVRDRASAQGKSETKDIIANMSARGFSLPQGAMVDLTLRLNQKTSEMVADANRDAMIKDAEIKHELLKFAEEQAIKYKLGMLAAMADMYKTWVLIPNNAVERERTRAMAMTAYYNAITDYYRVEMSFEELRLKAAETKAEVELKNVSNSVAAAEAGMPDLGGLGAAARAFGDAASGAASAASSLVASIESI